MENQNDDDIILDEEAAGDEQVREKLKKIKEELKICQKDRAEYLAGWQRAKADFINARRDEEKNRTEFAKFASEQVLKEILSVVDSLELLIKSNSGGQGGVDVVYRQFAEILKKFGVEEIESKDKEFDPMYHEAIEQIETQDEGQDGMILELMQKGYKIYDKVLRPAKVKVGHYKHNANIRMDTNETN
ncbi:nucleotide exchange factor GrpE [Candidatus Giovannonibacteria bacterium]|nr:nucleotide exchange factor GrpE [Candidatus Giovannonibacteria bacterium]